MKTNKFIFLVGYLILIAILSCSNNDDPSIVEKETHLIFIGLDGWSGYDFEKTLSHMPHVNNYCMEGAYSDKKLAVLPTVSAPNWASIFMGTTPDIHDYKKWDSKGPSAPYTFEVKNNIFPTISQALRIDKPMSEIGLFCQWEGIKYLADTLSINHVSYIPLIETTSHSVFSDSISSYLKTFKPILCSIVFDDPDHTGHRKNYFSNDYYSILEELDECISKIVMSIKDAGYYDDTVFIITSDHGGSGNSHGGETLEEKQTCFVIWGKGIRQIGFFDDNLEQQDIALIMAHILDINIPKLWTGKPHNILFNN